MTHTHYELWHSLPIVCIALFCLEMNVSSIEVEALNRLLDHDNYDLRARMLETFK